METLHLSEVEQEQIWAWTREGQSVRMVARRLGWAQASVRGYLALTGLCGRRWEEEPLIAGWLARAYPDDPQMRVSQETIYLTLFVQARATC